jgi:hypothetical protein
LFSNTAADTAAAAHRTAFKGEAPVAGPSNIKTDPSTREASVAAPGNPNINALKRDMLVAIKADIGIDPITNGGGNFAWSGMHKAFYKKNVIMTGFPYKPQVLKLPHQGRSDKGISAITKPEQAALRQALDARVDRDGYGGLRFHRKTWANECESHLVAYLYS